MMKELVVIVCVLSLFVVWTCGQEDNQRSAFKQKLQTYMVECARRFNIQTIINAYSTTDGKPPSRDFQCFVSCMYVKLGFMEENGNIKVDQVKEHLKLFIDEVKSKEIMERCMGEEGKDACETAYKVSKCSRGVIRNIIKNENEEK